MCLNGTLLSAIAGAAEVNAWDLCHHLVTQGFGVAGLSATEAAEPDLEQPWITGIPVEHALAALRTWDKPTDPDTRLPTGPGYFWFRDSSHSQLEATHAAVGRPTDRVRAAHFYKRADAVNALYELGIFIVTVKGRCAPGFAGM